MGYNTDFKGELSFATELTATQLAELNTMLGEDCRDHPEWGTGDSLSYIDLELTKNFSGLRWNGSEKTYDLEKKVTLIIERMRVRWPDFTLTGQLLAQGEDTSDRWALVIGDDGIARRQEIALTGTIIECPHCGERIALEDKK